MTHRANLVALAVVAIVVRPQLSYAQWAPNGVPVCAAPNDQYIPQIASDGAGGAIITWYDYRSGTDYDIYAQRVQATGVVDPAWPSNGTPVCVAANDQANPQIVPDGRGGAIVTWSDLRGGPSSDIYAQHVQASGAADPGWTANGTLVCDAANDQANPQLVSDGAGGAIVTWQDYRNGNADVYAQHILAAGVVDPKWTANGTVLCNAVNHQYDPRIVSDGAGGAIVTWYDYRSGNADIYAQHVLASGLVDPAWAANGTLLCNAPNDQVAPSIVADGVGGAIVAWEDARSGTTNSDIYAQRVQASGVVDPGWPLNGTLLCDAANNQISTTIVSDGVGGAIVAWYDLRGGAGFDIYAQHVQTSGAVDPAWTANGALLCNAPNNQGYPKIASDGVGGAIVTWEDYRSGTSDDVYAQHVRASGLVDPGWTANGNVLCDAPGDQRFPQIVSDGVGGAIVTWTDFRGAGTDIYAQRVYGAGGVSAVPPAGGERFAVHAMVPNPTRGGSRIGFDLPRAERVSASVYDISGQHVRTLAPGRVFSPGNQSLLWDGTTDAGLRAPAGIYFVRVSAEDGAVTRPAVVLR